MDWLLQPLQYDFIIRALLAAVIVGIVCSVLGVFIVLRGMAFLGDAMSHTILPGVCLLYTSPSPRDRTRSRMPSSA